MKPHKHAELIKAWADGAEIEYKSSGIWVDEAYPDWYPEMEYRIKPEPKFDDFCYYKAERNISYLGAPDVDWIGSRTEANLKLIFDGETGKLKDAEVLK